MNIKITFTEIQDLIKTTANQKVALKTIDQKTLEVTYTASIKIPIIGNVEKDIVLNIEPKEINGLDLTIGYSLTWGLDFIMNTIKILASRFIDIITWGKKENELIIHIGKILENSGVENVEEYTQCVHHPIMNVEPDGLNLMFDLKLPS